jgi:hypothetical protein
MSGGIWTLTELVTAPAATRGEDFAWSASPSPGTLGGSLGNLRARAAPKAPWTFGGMQRQKRTDYPGATTPSVQVLGPQQKPFTLEGSFDDRYNYPGFAVEEMRRFEAMCERGNLVRIAFEDQAFVGLITDWTFPYRRAWQIGYQFTFDVHARPDNFDLTDRVPDTAVAPATMFDALDTAVQAALDADLDAPRTLLTGTTVDDTSAQLSAMASSVDQLGRTLDNRDATPPENPVDGFSRIATQCREVQGAAYNVLLELAIARSDTVLAAQTAIGVLDFEVWSRSLRFASRVAMAQAAAAARAAQARAQPDATRLYRPQAGESLYAISRKFLGTPFAWRLIYDRNALDSVTLTGREILVIPERGQA